MFKYVYNAGWRKVTVRAKDRNAAALKARSELDRRCEKSGDEPPVAWSLALIETDDPNVKEADNGTR